MVVEREFQGTAERPLRLGDLAEGPGRRQQLVVAQQAPAALVPGRAAGKFLGGAAVERLGGGIGPAGQLRERRQRAAVGARWMGPSPPPGSR
ncbi:hypothetical protein ACFQY5_24665 [Paeniroseomonas aquatica]|uniref:hypothetical protein n=1 Tax=Paeniroseomonas aquatica TaxID=373043 RepID=UPI00361345F0